MWGQNAIDRLQPLVETSARRLVLAKEVALAKWDAQAPIEDLTREAQVITAAAKEGESKGLNRTFVSSFFAAQIEANKLVQYWLLADWHRAGGAPKHQPVSLTKDIRPQLDQMEAALIAELVETADIRTNASCQDHTAKAAGKYFARRHPEHCWRSRSTGPWQPTATRQRESVEKPSRMTTNGDELPSKRKNRGCSPKTISFADELVTSFRLGYARSSRTMRVLSAI